MKARLIGINRLNFKSQSGEVINGNNLYIAFEHQDTEGLRCDKVFLRAEINLPADVKINDLIEIYFNMRGKVEKIEKISK